MYTNSSKKSVKKLQRNLTREKKTAPAGHWKRARNVLAVPVWMAVAFFAVNIVVALAVTGIVKIGVPLNSFNPALMAAVLSFVVYAMALLVVIYVPARTLGIRATLSDLGIVGMVAWQDILLAIPLYLVAEFTAVIVVGLVSFVFPIMDYASQELPFSQSMLAAQWQYLLAFFTLVVLAPVVEEILFRGYIHGMIRKIAPAWVAVVLTALTFGLMHLYAGGDAPLQWMVALTTGVLGASLSLAREFTGAIWAGICVHMLKNGIAFYALFVNPHLFQNMQDAMRFIGIG